MSARNRESCLHAGGDWADAYKFGMMIAPRPEAGSKYLGKMCWSNRQINKLPDAGKACTGPADCIGNCLSSIQTDGTWSAPQCQSYAGDVLCERAIDGTRWRDLDCPPA